MADDLVRLAVYEGEVKSAAAMSVATLHGSAVRGAMLGLWTHSRQPIVQLLMNSLNESELWQVISKTGQEMLGYWSAAAPVAYGSGAATMSAEPASTTLKTADAYFLQIMLGSNMGASGGPPRVTATVTCLQRHDGTRERPVRIHLLPETSPLRWNIRQMVGEGPNMASQLSVEIAMPEPPRDVAPISNTAQAQPRSPQHWYMVPVKGERLAQVLLQAFKRTFGDVRMLQMSDKALCFELSAYVLLPHRPKVIFPQHFCTYDWYVTLAIGDSGDTIHVSLQTVSREEVMATGLAQAVRRALGKVSVVRR